MRHSAAFLVATFAVAPFCSVTALQQPPPVKLGDHVRVTAPNLGINKLTGVLQAVGDDTLVVDTVGLPLVSVTRFEVRRGRESRVGLGMGVGLLGGTLTGAAIGAYLKDCGIAGTTAGKCARSGGVVGAVGGALIGAVIGAVIKTDRWEEFPLDLLHVRLGLVCAQPVDVTYDDQGTFTTDTMTRRSVAVSGSAAVNVVNLNGLGVVGGASSHTVDGAEWLRFAIDTGAAIDVSYRVPFTGNGDGDDLTGEATIEGFDVAGASLGSVPVSGGGALDVSGRFSGKPLSAFVVAAQDGDLFRISSLTFTPCQ